MSNITGVVIKECVGDDGETYYDINGTWYRVNRDQLENTSKPKMIKSCKVLTLDKQKEFFTKHLIKNKGEQ